MSGSGSIAERLCDPPVVRMPDEQGNWHHVARLPTVAYSVLLSDFTVENEEAPRT